MENEPEGVSFLGSCLESGRPEAQKPSSHPEVLLADAELIQVGQIKKPSSIVKVSLPNHPTKNETKE